MHRDSLNPVFGMELLGSAYHLHMSSGGLVPHLCRGICQPKCVSILPQAVMGKMAQRHMKRTCTCPSHHDPSTRTGVIDDFAKS